jgi:energy-coupling factor transporter transmembrane protein EcfT
MIDAPSHGKGRKWVRTFLLSMPIDSPLVGLHAITKVVMVLGVSFALLRMFSASRPDPVGCIILLVVAVVLLWLSGVIKWLFRSFLVMMYPMLLSFFLVWTAFNPSPGNRVLFSRQMYSGVITLGTSVGLIVLVSVVIGYYLYTKELLWGIVGGLVAAFVISQTGLNFTWTLASVPFGEPLTLVISDWTIYVAATKVLGYSAMVLLTLLLILTTRDIEMIGALRRLPGMPYAICLFSSLALRSLSIAVIDFSTVRQAQVTRGINVRKKNFLAKVKDLAHLSVPLMANMMRRSTEMSDALSARGYEMGSSPATYREVRPLRAVDWLLILGTLALVVAVLVVGVNATELAQILVSRFGT